MPVIEQSGYQALRADGAPRWRAVLLATGWWTIWPFRLAFPAVDAAPYVRAADVECSDAWAHEAKVGPLKAEVEGLRAQLDAAAATILRYDDEVERLRSGAALARVELDTAIAMKGESERNVWLCIERARAAVADDDAR